MENFPDIMIDAFLINPLYAIYFVFFIFVTSIIVFGMAVGIFGGNYYVFYEQNLNKMYELYEDFRDGMEGVMAKTYLEGDDINKVVGKIALVRNLEEGTPAVSPPTFDDLITTEDFKNFADKVRKITGGIPIGFKLSANHIEEDIQFALDASADYIILDGRGGGTGAAPLIFRDNISVPTIPALARARHYLDKINRKDVTLIITGGIRIPADFIKAMALGADGIALSNSALQAIGCVAARMCNTNNCPAGIATQKPELRKLFNIDKSAIQLFNFFSASTELMKVMARACGHDHLNKFNQKDITSWKKDMAELTGIKFAGL